MLRPSIALATVLLAGCAGILMRPGPDAAPETRPVFLLDHGRHSSLILTRADGSMVRYLYGDWRWYAERKTGVLRAIPTLFASTPSALGRQELTAPVSASSIRRQIPVAIRTIHRLSAPGKRIDALDRRLQQEFDRLREQSHYSAAFDLEFVPGPHPYTLFNNSNHVVAGWLRSLGIEVRGNPVLGTWRVIS